MLTIYLLWIMQTYLTNVWKLGFTHAAGIMNVANGLPKVLPLVFYYFVDAGLGNFWMLVLSSFSYTFGLGLLYMSTPPVLADITKTCKDYEPQCIGDTQKALFYTGLALIAAGISGHIVSLVAFFVDQLGPKPEMKPVVRKDVCIEVPTEEENHRLLMKKLQERGGGADKALLDFLSSRPPAVPIIQETSKPEESSEINLLAFQFQPVEAIMELVTKKKVKQFQACLVVLFPVVVLIIIPYIQLWSLKFGISAVCSLVATLVFLLGSGKYEDHRSKGSPVTNVFRVLLASTLNMFKTCPSSSKLEQKNKNVEHFSHTLGLGLLDKAAIEDGTGNKRSWLVCTPEEVEDTKMVIRMIPIWITLIICGVVTSIGTTFFVEQANHMSYKFGRFNLPNSMLLFLYQTGKSQSKKMYTSISQKLEQRKAQYAAPAIGIALATFSAALCCILAAIVETRRLQVITDHGLIDKPDELVPMTVFWIVPQYFLLAVLDSFYESSVSPFLTENCPPSMQKYLVFLNPGLSGMGMVGSISSVYVAGRASRRNGKPWFQHSLNESRLDRYYWTLAGLSAVNLVWFAGWAMWYPYRIETSNAADEQNRSQATNQEEAGIAEHAEEATDIY
ncbi:OLC1v1032024C2 [Oldenlandia corymbosa var. corymbosa]|nr:OLC1v1032024C2 [Oldenlandia corymbosa var. corymbosa]